MAEKTRPVEGASRAENRPQRVPVGQRNVIKYAPIPGYRLRIVNDVEDRLDVFKAAGYEVVTGKDYGETVGDPDCADPKKLGSAITKHVGLGRTGVLMKIKEEYYQEQQAIKQREVNEVEATMQESAEKERLTDRLGNERLEGIQITR